MITVSRQDARTWTTPGLEAGVRSLLESPSCPFGVLVLDDATPADVERIVPAASTVPVIVTTRMPIAGQECVRIGPFTAEEAATYLTTTLPEVTIEDAAKLSRMLGYRPLALVAVEGVVNAQVLELSRLVESLMEDVAGTLQYAERLTNSRDVMTLQSPYAIIAEQIGAETIQARLVDALIWTVGNCPIRREDLTYQTYGLPPLTAANEVALVASLHWLDGMGVITQRDDVIEMNELTREILRSIRVEQSTIALERLKRNLLDSQVPVEREKVMQSNALLWREEYQTFRDAMTDVVCENCELAFSASMRSPGSSRPGRGSGAKTVRSRQAAISSRSRPVGYESSTPEADHRRPMTRQGWSGSSLRPTNP